MIKEKGYTIDFALIVKEQKKLVINAEWLKGSIYFWINRPSFLKIFLLVKIIGKGKYDFIYGHGGGGGWGNMAALIARKPFGMRYYGTFLSSHLEEGYLRFMRRNLLKTIVYNLPKCFMLMTNDGTKGDLVYNKLCLNKRLYEFNFWLNGVNKNDSLEKSGTFYGMLKELSIQPDDLILLYPARYDPWKRQDLAIEILHNLRLKGQLKFKLLFFGHKNNVKYYDKLLGLVDSYKLHGNVIFSAPIDSEILRCLMSMSFATLAFYSFSNLGNVLIEASLAGAFVITIKDGSTDFLIENEVTGLTLPLEGDYISCFAYNIIDYSAHEEKRRKMSLNLKSRADNIFLDWDQRSEKEIALIEKCIDFRQ